MESTATPVIAILGASGGIGSALCERLHQRGYRLALAGRNDATLAELGTRLQTVPTVLDATDLVTVESFMQKVVQTYGRLDGVVNLAGSILLKPAHLTSIEEWQQTIDQNLTSAFVVLRSAVKAMLRQGGAIVLMSSAAAQLGLVNHEAIAAAKAGVIGLMRAAAATYANKNIRVNAVAPGLIETPLAAGLVASESARKASLALHPLNRLGRPEEVAALLVWLLDPENAWITGQVIGIDGGLATLKGRPNT